jgi:hypothetical protein
VLEPLIADDSALGGLHQAALRLGQVQFYRRRPDRLHDLLVLVRPPPDLGLKCLQGLPDPR